VKVRTNLAQFDCLVCDNSLKVMLVMWDDRQL